MSYTEINARRELAKRLYEIQCREDGAYSWAELPPAYKREFERDVETLFDPRNERILEAMQALGWEHDKRS